MATLQQLRSLFPTGKSDGDVMSLAAKEFGMNVADIANDVGYDAGSGGLTSKRLGGSADRYQSNLYGVGGAVARKLGMPGVGAWMDEGRDDNAVQADVAGQRAKALGGVDDWRDINGVASGANFVGGLAAQSFPYLVESAAGGLAGRGLAGGARAALRGAETLEVAKAARNTLNQASMVGAAAASYPSAVGDILSNQREENGGEDLGMAALGGVPYAGLNMVGVEGLVARGVRPRDLLQGSTLARVGKAAGVTALEEGASETGQEMINQGFGRMAVNPDQTMFNPEANKRYLDSFVGGAALGGVMGGAGGLRGPERTVQPVADNEPRDLLNPEPQGDPQRLGYSPLAGTPIIFPDGTVTLNGEQELSNRYPDTPFPGGPEERPNLPETLYGVPGGGVVADPQNQNLLNADFSQDPGSELARQQWLDKRAAEAAKVQAQQQQAQELQAEAQRQQAEKARIESLGVPAKGDNHKLYQELEALRDDGTITPAQFTENAAKIVGETPVDRNGARKFVRDVVKAQQPVVSKPPTAAEVAQQADTDNAPKAAPAAAPTEPKSPSIAKLRQKVAAEKAARVTAAAEAAPEVTVSDEKVGGVAVEKVAYVAPAKKAVADDGATRDARASAALVETLLRSNRESEGPKVAVAYEAFKRRLSAVTGFYLDTDEDTGATVLRQDRNPIPMTEVAAAEGVTRAAISKQLNQHGVSDEVVGALAGVESGITEDAETATVDGDGGNETGSDADTMETSDAAAEEIGGRVSTTAARATGAGQVTGEDFTPGARATIARAIAKAVELGGSAEAIQTVVAPMQQTIDQAVGVNATEAEAEVEDSDGATAEAEDTAYNGDGSVKAAKAAAAKEKKAGLLAEDVRQASRIKSAIIAGVAERMVVKEKSNSKDAPKTAQDLAMEAERAKRAEATVTREVAVWFQSNDNGRLAASWWDDRAKANNQPLFTTLAPETQFAWAKALSEVTETNLNDRTYDNIYSKLAGTQTSDSTGNIRQDAGALDESGRGTPDQTGTGRGVAAAPVVKKRVVRDAQGRKINQDVLGPDTATAAAINRDVTGPGIPNVAINSDAAQFSKAANGEGSKAAELESDLKKFMRVGAFGNKVTVVQSMADLPAGIQRSVNPTADTQGFVVNGKAYLIADNIAPGKGRAVFLHEIGAHLGLENLMGKDQYAALVSKVKQWAAKNDGSQDSKLAQAAQQRVADAGTDATQADSELVAYFIEEAVDAGIDPTATKGDTEFGRWFRTIWAAFKTAMHKLGVNPDKLTAQDVVDMAYGAAKLEATGTFHGTAADFRKFNHKYLSTGEGRGKPGAGQAYGAGSYFAQDPENSEGYMKRDVRNKNKHATRTQIEGDIARHEEDIAFLEESIKSEETNGYYRTSAGERARSFDSRENVRRAQEKIQAHRDMIREFTKMRDALTEGNLMRTDLNIQEDEWLDLSAPVPDEQMAKLPQWVQDDIENLDYNVDGMQLQRELTKMAEEGAFFPEVLAAKAMERATPENLKYYEGGMLTLEELAGPKLTEEVSNMLPAQIVSAFLDSVGIKGNKNLDSNSRLEVERSAREKPDLRRSIDRIEGEMATLQADIDRRGGALNENNWRFADMADHRKMLDILKGKLNSTPETTFNFTVFNDKNIQRVSSMKAADRNRVSFSKAAKPQTMQQFSDKLPGRVADLWDSFKTTVDEVSVKAMFTQDLVDMASKVLPSAAKYLKAMTDIQIERGKAERVVADVVEDFRALPAHERGMGPSSVNAFIKESTMTGKWAFAPDWVPGAVVDPALKARFEAALSPKAQELVKRVFRRGHESLVEMQTAAIANADSEYNALIAEAQKAGDAKEVASLTSAKAKSLKDFQGLLGIHKGTPYAPLKRFGNYVVMAVSQEYKAASEAGDAKAMQEMQRNGDHYHIEFTDTNREARARARELESSFPGGFVGKMEKGDDGLMMGGRDMLGAFGRLRKVMADSVVDNPNVDKATGKRIDDMMRQLYLTLLAETSARKGEIHRKNVAGANDDMMRAFATQGRATAHFIAGLKTSGKVDDHLAAMRTETKALNNGREERTRYYNEIIRRHSMGLEYKPSPMIDQMMAGTSAMMLLTNPSYHLMNALQPGMMTIPLLAGRHGYAKSWAALTRAYTELGPILKEREFTEKSYGKLPADVRQAIEDLANMGKIDIMMDADLGSVESASDSKVKRPFVIASEWLKGVSQDVEAMNRLSSAIAAYRLEKDRPGTSHDQAVKYASGVIYETHGDYSGFNAPRFMRSGIGRLATQFKKFQLIQISMFARMASRSWRDDPSLTPAQNAEAKTAARYALTYTLSHLLAMGGVMGLPGFAAIAWVVGKVWPGDDEPDDPEATLRRAIGNEALADFLLQGAPTLGGVNVSGRIGAGGMLSLLPYTDVELSRKSYPEMVTAAMGPFIGGVVPRAIGGLELMAKGELVKGTEALLPNGLGNAVKSVRFGVDGVSKGNGDTLMSANDINALDIFGQAFGLPPTKLTDRMTESASQYKAEQFYKDRTGSLKQQYTKAAKSNDADTMRDLRVEWTNTQAARKAMGFQPSPLSDLLKSPQEQRKREAATQNGVQYNKGNQGFNAALQ